MLGCGPFASQGGPLGGSARGPRERCVDGELGGRSRRLHRAEDLGARPADPSISFGGAYERGAPDGGHGTKALVRSA